MSAPIQIIDALGKEEEKAVWNFCGAFPLKEIAAGRRACREGWRSGSHTRLGEECMLAVMCTDESNGLLGENRVCIEWEFAEEFEGDEPFCYIESMMAHDWYLEQEKK